MEDALKEEAKKVKVITNGCVDAQGFFSFDEIKKILDTTSDVEEQKEMLRRNHDQLIGRTAVSYTHLCSINRKGRLKIHDPTRIH